MSEKMAQVRRRIKEANVRASPEKAVGFLVLKAIEHLLAIQSERLCSLEIRALETLGKSRGVNAVTTTDGLVACVSVW